MGMAQWRAGMQEAARLVLCLPVPFYRCGVVRFFNGGGYLLVSRETRERERAKRMRRLTTRDTGLLVNHAGQPGIGLD